MNARRSAGRAAFAGMACLVAVVVVTGCSGDQKTNASASATVSPTAQSSEPEPSPTDVGSAAPVEDPVAPPATPVIRDGVQPTPSISADPASFSEPVTYPDGIALEILDTQQSTTEGEGPGIISGLPQTTFTVRFSNGSQSAIDMNRVVVTAIYGPDRRVARPLYDDDMVQDFSGLVEPGASVETPYAFSIPTAELDDVVLTVDFDGLHAAATFQGAVG